MENDIKKEIQVYPALFKAMGPKTWDVTLDLWILAYGTDCRRCARVIKVARDIDFKVGNLIINTKGSNWWKMRVYPEAFWIFLENSP